MLRPLSRLIKSVISLPIILAGSLSACAPVHLLNGLTPSGSYKLSKNHQYGPLAEQTLDIYAPKTPRTNAPLVMFVYGGSWNSGNKDIYKFIAQAFTAQGYTVIIPNYRIYPDVIYPEFIEDTAKAVSYVHSRFDKPMVIIGHSAGAHIASLLALDPRYLAAQGLKACEVFTGWVGLAGPYDFKIWEEPYLSIFPQALRERDIQPISYAANSTVPALVITGANDETVEPAQTLRMAQALREAPQASARAPVTSHVYDDINHIRIMVRLSKVLRRDGVIHNDVMDFVSKRQSVATCPDE